MQQFDFSWALHPTIVVPAASTRCCKRSVIPTPWWSHWIVNFGLTERAGQLGATGKPQIMRHALPCSDDSDRSEEEAVTPSRLAQLSAKANGKAVSRTSNLDVSALTTRMSCIGSCASEPLLHVTQLDHRAVEPSLMRVCTALSTYQSPWDMCRTCGNMCARSPATNCWPATPPSKALPTCRLSARRPLVR